MNPRLWAEAGWRLRNEAHLLSWICWKYIESMEKHFLWRQRIRQLEGNDCLFPNTKGTSTLDLFYKGAKKNLQMAIVCSLLCNNQQWLFEHIPSNCLLVSKCSPKERWKKGTLIVHLLAKFLLQGFIKKATQCPIRRSALSIKSEFRDVCYQSKGR